MDPATVTDRRQEPLGWTRQQWRVDEVAAAEGVAAEGEEVDEVDTVAVSVG